MTIMEGDKCALNGNGYQAGRLNDAEKYHLEVYRVEQSVRLDGLLGCLHAKTNARRANDMKKKIGRLEDLIIFWLSTRQV